MSAFAAPFYCPYCAEEDLRPLDPTDGSAGHGQWRCQSCRRAFGLKYVGLTRGSVEVEADPVGTTANTIHERAGRAQ